MIKTIIEHLEFLIILDSKQNQENPAVTLSTVVTSAMQGDELWEGSIWRYQTAVGWSLMKITDSSCKIPSYQAALLMLFDCIII